MRKALFIALGVVTVIIAFSAYTNAQTNIDQDRTVAAVKVANNKTISSETILSKIKTRVGDKINQDSLNDDIKRLYATEYFTDVSVDVKSTDNGMEVTFIVEEKSLVDDIVFKGNVAFKPQKLKSMMKSKPGEMLNPAILAQDAAEIRDAYIKKGYPQADVKYVVDVDKETNKAKVTIVIDEKARVKVTSITINGNKAIKTANIKKVLSTKPAWLFNQGIFKDDVLQEDLDKVKFLYDDIGYLDAQVSPKLDYSQDGTQLAVTINIDEGKQYLVGDVTIKGNLVLPQKQVLAKLTMMSGKPFSNRQLREDMSNIKQDYYEYGYMNMTIDVERNLNPTTERIDITYMIDGKEPVYVGKVEIRGNTKTKDKVIRRELRVYPGERFDGKKIKRSKERLYNLGFFENVSFDTEPTDKSSVQNLVATVKETKTGEFSFGGGYSSIDLLVGFVEITQRNFDIMNFPTFMGGGQLLTVKAELGMVRSNFNFGWTEPWIFDMPYSFGIDGYRTSHNRDDDVGWAYDETRLGGDLRLGHEFTDYLKGFLTYRLENIDIGNVVDNASQDLKNEEGNNTISSVAAELTQDARDNVFNPTKGYMLTGSAECAGGFLGGTKDFCKFLGSASVYQSFLQKFVLELRGRAGVAKAYGDSDEVPIYERFFAGGANTIRGYRERYVGPRDSGSDDPIGGEAILLGNVELTFPVYEKVLKAAVFYDVGSVWRRAGDFISGGDFKSGVGVGVRVNTPVGPVKVDYGVPLSDNHNDSKEGQFYFSMSRGF